MKILVVANQKGGVSKSTACQILAPYSAAVCGLNTLIVDLDEQANLALRYIKMRKNETGEWLPERHPEADEILKEDPDFVGYSAATDIIKYGIVYPYSTSHELLTILPPHGGHIKEIASASSNEQIQASLYNFFNLPEVQDMGWDLVIIDTPPSLGALTLSAIRASTHVLIPAILERKCMEGLTGVLTKVNMENRKKPKSEKTEILGILPTQFQSQQPLHKKYFRTLENDPTFSDLLIRQPMCVRSDIKMMDEKVKSGTDINPISPFDKRSFKAKNRRECELWCKEIMDRMFGKEAVDAMIKTQSEVLTNAS